MRHLKKILLVGMILMIPKLLLGQSAGGVAGDLQSFQAVLDQLYNQMMPLCGSLIGVSRGIAGFGALWYISARVWRSLAHAEPIDFYPLFRPFAIGLCILMFPLLIGVINGLMQPIVKGTAHMVDGSSSAIAALLQAKEEALQETNSWQMFVGTTGEGDRDRWYQYTHPGASVSGEGLFEGIGDDIKFAMAKASYNFRSSVKQWMSEVLQVLFQAAALCINTLRTFNLIILAILGPLVLGLSVFDGFQHTLSHWLARYINVFLWLPVANIFGAVIGKVQENMLRIDLAQIGQTGNTFFNPTDVAYLIFLIIAILGYFTVPSVAGHIVWVGGGDALSRKTTMLATGVAGGALSGSMAATTGGATLAAQGMQSMLQLPGHLGSPGTSPGDGPGNRYAGGDQYQRERLSGKD